MKKILITGGAGYIGSVLANALHTTGYEVIVVDDLSAGVKENLQRGIKLHVMSILDEQLSDLFTQAKPDVIFHLAASKSVNDSMHNAAKFRQTNVEGSKNVIDLAIAAGVKKIVFTSTAGVYGDIVEGRASKETDTPHPSSPYAETKLETEKYLLSKSSEGLEGIVLRFANVYGPGGETTYKSAINIFTEKILSNKPIEVHGDGTQTRDFVHISDLVAVCIACTRLTTSQGLPIFNISTGKSTSINEAISHISERANMAPQITYRPADFAGQKSSALDPAYTLSTFGWSPKITFSEGVKSLLKSIR